MLSTTSLKRGDYVVFARASEPVKNIYQTDKIYKMLYEKEKGYYDVDEDDEEYDEEEERQKEDEEKKKMEQKEKEKLMLEKERRKEQDERERNNDNNDNEIQQENIDTIEVQNENKDNENGLINEEQYIDEDLDDDDLYEFDFLLGDIDEFDDEDEDEQQQQIEPKQQMKIKQQTSINSLTSHEQTQSSLSSIDKKDIAIHIQTDVGFGKEKQKDIEQDYGKVKGIISFRAQGSQAKQRMKERQQAEEEQERKRLREIQLQIREKVHEDMWKRRKKLQKQRKIERREMKEFFPELIKKDGI
ncbi:MAG: hypothetical protein EZS28_001479 [Streblomastix strix]|uniref:Uncharacterized protein n=1 Tax=Streblomastix strix TaxID=222440 RepID=A0A5J4X822_9EUKA|nr:MAG: hypothetical protein EZS28_001479 [Streblomastix strix]